jgi:hypothetical protein
VGWEKIVAREDIADHLENHNLVAAERRALGDVERSSNLSIWLRVRGVSRIGRRANIWHLLLWKGGDPACYATVSKCIEGRPMKGLSLRSPRTLPYSRTLTAKTRAD